MSEIVHENTENIVCPICGHEHTDSWEYEDDSGEITCQGCNKEFFFEREYDVSYTTSKHNLDTEKYQPSNGTEGAIFIDSFCMKCRHCDPNPEGKKQCNILANTIIFSANDDEYPSEWTYTKAGKPTCTKHQQWDWYELGDPDDPENPNYVQPYNPNQMTLF